MTFDLDAYLARELGRVEERLRSRLAQGLERLNAPEEWTDVTEAGVHSGGKRIRPILCITAYRTAADLPAEAPVPTAVYDVAVALEMIHAYSLMHDDLPSMDDAALRRGAPTPHTRFGVEPTLRAGMALIPTAAWSAWEAGVALGSDDKGRELATLLMDAAGAAGMVGGQAVDLDSEGLALAEGQLTRLHRMKTGALLRASLEMGGVAAGATGARLEALRTYGEAIGLAFQIADDVLDRTGTAESLGKNPSDVALDKSTYVSLLGVDGAIERGAQTVHMAKTALSEAGMNSPALNALADYILSRAR